MSDRRSAIRKRAKGVTPNRHLLFLLTPNLQLPFGVLLLLPLSFSSPSSSSWPPTHTWVHLN